MLVLNLRSNFFFHVIMTWDCNNLAMFLKMKFKYQHDFEIVWLYQTIVTMINNQNQNIIDSALQYLRINPSTKP